MWLWTIRYIDENGKRMKYETEVREELDNFILTLPESILKQAYVFDPDNRGGINAWVYIEGRYNQKFKPELLRTRILSIIFFVIGGFPILLFPLVFASFGMLFAAYYDFGFQGTLLDAVLLTINLIVISSYPVTYIACLIIANTKKGSNKKLLLSIAPLVHLFLISLYFIEG